MKIWNDLQTLEPQWYGAAAGAAAAGAVLFPAYRVAAGLAGAATVLALALRSGGTPPCCDGCADHSKPCAGSAVAPTVAAPKPFYGGIEETPPLTNAAPASGDATCGSCL